MSIKPSRAAAVLLPKSLHTILLWASLIAAAVALWQLEPTPSGWGEYRLVVIFITVLTIFAVWALGWLVFSRTKWRRDIANRSGTTYPTNGPIG